MARSGVVQEVHGQVGAVVQQPLVDLRHSAVLLVAPRPTELDEEGLAVGEEDLKGAAAQHVASAMDLCHTPKLPRAVVRLELLHRARLPQVVGCLGSFVLLPSVGPEHHRLLAHHKLPIHGSSWGDDLAFKRLLGRFLLLLIGARDRLGGHRRLRRLKVHSAEPRDVLLDQEALGEGCGRIPRLSSHSLIEPLI
eukprot:CAMPEP_0206251944 /NCGR_PEP_ID=MMETSP0047_2-20121206/22302_1 /ASSEMBLY_ACC=CAM_ASM_000192 /TAXON_ID=195065 /ORGANISM="Chroomonas mesostigmatica_cf, Strain CCMP1168" /LENGTH=193 /DNA_ID=CAMNT_0053677947 /DNA_START=1168 /DNA_END=1748 /DNA_ORIENTATION=+